MLNSILYSHSNVFPFPFSQFAKRGPVLHVRASMRTGENNFVTCMRQSLAAHFGTRPVAMGGVFVITKGEAKLHVMVSTFDLS